MGGTRRSIRDGRWRLAGPYYWRSSFNGIPQLFVELDEPRLDGRPQVREAVTACHVGFMMSNRFAERR
jgi:hypothetical protein